MDITRDNWLEKASDFLFWFVLTVFLLATILPGRPFLFSPRKLLYLSLMLGMIKAFWSWKRSKGSPYLEIFPFLIFFLISCFRFSRFAEYTFGVDDAYYYSYASSLCIDGDLDLANQYQAAGLNKFSDQRPTLEARTSAGYSPNIYPVGLSFFWLPFFLLGQLLANLSGVAVDGYTRPFTHAVGTGSLFYFFAGLYFCYRFCALFFSKIISMIMTWTILFATPHLYLFTQSFLLVSEPVSFGLIAFFLFCVVWVEKQDSGLKWFLLGLLLGAITMVRFQNCVIGILPVALLVLKYRSRGAISKSALFIAGAVLGFVPQVMVWIVIYGEWFVEMGETFLPWWKSPFVLETLFSARKGLFPWSPIALLGVTGLALFVTKNRIYGWLFVTIFISTVWINSAHADWWGATSLGSRRFVPFASIFVVGLASLYFSLNRISRHLMAVFIGGLIFLNLFFVSSFRSGSLQGEHADRFSDVLTGSHSIFRPVVYALQFPVQAAYKIRYGTPLYGELTEFFIGEDVFYFQRRAGEKLLSQESPLFGDGWITENGVTKTSGAVSVFYVPLFLKDKPRMVIELSLLPLDQEKDVWIDFYWNGKFLRSRKISMDGRQLEVPFRSRDYRVGVNELTMNIYHSKSQEPAPPLILERIYFRPPSNLAELYD